MPPPPPSPAAVPSLHALTISLRNSRTYITFAHAYCVLYLTPYVPYLEPAIVPLAFIVLYHLFRRTFLFSNCVPNKSSSAWTNRQSHRFTIPHKVQVNHAYPSNQYRQRQSQERAEGTEDCFILARLFICCASRSSECEIILSTYSFSD